VQVQFPSCPIRCLIIHQYAPGIKKAGSQPCQITNIGKRGKAVKKMRFIPAEKAFEFAKRFAGNPGCTVSVI
jgi:hypothetical protein